eukprot:8709122-Karenia_brevis.AAC.1
MQAKALYEEAAKCLDAERAAALRQMAWRVRKHILWQRRMRCLHANVKRGRVIQKAENYIVYM